MKVFLTAILVVPIQTDIDQEQDGEPGKAGAAVEEVVCRKHISIGVSSSQPIRHHRQEGPEDKGNEPYRIYFSSVSSHSAHSSASRAISFM